MPATRAATQTHPSSPPPAPGGRRRGERDGDGGLSCQSRLHRDKPGGGLLISFPVSLSPENVEDHAFLAAASARLSRIAWILLLCFQCLHLLGCPQNPHCHGHPQSGCQTESQEEDAAGVFSEVSHVLGIAQKEMLAKMASTNDQCCTERESGDCDQPDSDRESLRDVLFLHLKTQHMH